MGRQGAPREGEDGGPAGPRRRRRRPGAGRPPLPLLAAALLAAALLAEGARGAGRVNLLLLGGNDEMVNTRTFTTRTPQGEYARQPWADGKMAYDSPALLGALGRIGMKNYRYPGGSIGNHWDLENARMCPLALNCTAYPATCEFNQSVDDARKEFPEGSFSVSAFYDFIEATGAAGAVLTINIIDCQPSLENATKFVAEAAERNITLRVEIGNESYGPNQMPPGNPYTSGFDYVNRTKALVQALAGAGAQVGVPVVPCPFFFNRQCWGGGASYERWRDWNGNVSAAMHDGTYPVRGVVAHNYPVDLHTLQMWGFKTVPRMSQAYLAYPEATMLNADDQLKKYPDGTKIWLSEYNVQYAQVWGNATGVEADFLRGTMNSGLHACFVAANILSGVARSDTVELMNYHSVLEVNTASQPGFAILALNATGSFISPVAQVMAHISHTLVAMHGQDAGVESVALAAGETLSIPVQGRTDLPCLQTVAFCTTAGAASAFVLNMCDRELDLSEELLAAMRSTCGEPSLAPTNSTIYPGSLGTPGETWARLDALAGDPPWNSPVSPQRSKSPPPISGTSFGVFDFAAAGVGAW